VRRFTLSFLRPLALLLLIEGGSVFLVRLAPGYFVDPTALDPRLSDRAYARMETEKATTHGAFVASFLEDWGLLRGELGESRYYHVPVIQLLAPRWSVTLQLLAGGLAFGWLAAIAAAFPVAFRASHVRSRTDRLLFVMAILLIAMPAGSLAAVSVASGYGTPIFIVAAFVAPRAYRFLAVLLRSQLDASHLLYARACGVKTGRILIAHILPTAGPEFVALVGTSLVMALGAVVPVEVVFDLNGIAQLAWTAALNRDAPVIAATTLLAGGTVAFAGMLTDYAVYRRASKVTYVPPTPIVVGME
jgi:peptide/nickel transport system permease protein